MCVSGCRAAVTARSSWPTAALGSRRRPGLTYGETSGPSVSARSTVPAVGRSDVRACRCGSLGRNVEDEHALIRAAHLKRPVILVGHSTGGLDALLYARRYRSDVSGLVLVDSPSESAPAPPTALADGNTQLDFASGMKELRRAGGLGDLPILVLSHGRRAFSTLAAERSWTAMQRRLTTDSSNTVRVIALGSRHVIEVDQPALVARAIEQVASSKGRLRCAPALARANGRCAR